MRSGKVSLHAVRRAFDEAEFGAKNTLNLRESLPTVPEAKHRTESWLRERQISSAGEVLVITGRGNNSPNGVSAVRQGILSLLPLLRRRGVVREWREHSPGSFVITLAPISALLEAPRRKRDLTRASPQPAPKSLDGLEKETIELLRKLAIRSLESLGVREPTSFVEAEMASKFNTLAAGIAPGVAGEARLRTAILAALDQLDE